MFWTRTSAGWHRWWAQSAVYRSSLILVACRLHWKKALQLSNTNPSPSRWTIQHKKTLYEKEVTEESNLYIPIKWTILNQASFIDELSSAQQCIAHPWCLMPSLPLHSTPTLPLTAVASKITEAPFQKSLRYNIFSHVTLLHPWIMTNKPFPHNQL